MIGRHLCVNNSYSRLGPRSIHTGAATPEAHQDYLRILYKRFLFFTHPDFFAADTPKQNTNTRNIAALSRIVDALLTDPAFDIQKSSYADTRSLIFYLKATEDMPQTRRVKISTKDLYRSIREILEDYDVTLPSPPKDLEKQNSSSASASPMPTQQVSISERVLMEDIEPFLDTLSIERAELLSWRRERLKSVEKAKRITQEKLGCRDIEVRYSSSPQTNSVTFKKLHGLLFEKESSMKLELGRWAHLTLVLSFDDCTGEAVDPVEGEIRLSPAQVTLEWLETLSSVREQTSVDALRHRLEMETLESCLNPALSALCQRNTISDFLRDVGIEDKRMVQAIRRGISLRIKRGKSCSKLSYKVFLTSLWEDMSQLTEEDVIPEIDTTVPPCDSDDEETTKRISPESDSRIYQQDGLISPSSLWLTQLPLTLSVVVESGHGSKVLRDGTVRIDSRANPSKLIGQDGLLRSKCFDAVKDTASTMMRRKALDEKLEILVNRLNLRSLKKGIGVSDDEVLGWVLRVLDHLDHQRGQSKLRNLKGHDVRIEHRTGVDGTTIVLPHLLLKS